MGPKSDYKFITVDAVEGTFQPANKSVRSHAIRTAIQRGGSQLGASTALISQGTIRGKAHLKGRFRLGGTATKPKNPKNSKNQRRKNTTEPASPDIYELLSEASLPPWIQRLGSDNADPFNTLPIPSSPSVDALVKYFTTRFNLNSTTTDTKRPWFPYAMQSALIMRTTLALAAEFLAATMPSPDPKLQREGYLQKGEAMRMVRSRLESRESAQRASDDLSVLAGVAMLGSVEAFQGHFSAANIHLTGLHAMITARGGPDTIKHDYILCRSINW
ncbi:tachykinin family protein [Colletotrichum tofieldiae]|nr:tachykinin family protein [Colletotrichum tofieldiae]GKT68589.1 tachykinin family protein [Colletotrichum tofieldiae]